MKELLTGIINKIQQIAEKLGLIADYVVEQGTSGIWTYRKWNSGIAECWLSYQGTVARYTDTLGLGPCTSGYAKTWDLPFAFTERYTKTATAQVGSGICVVMSGGLNDTLERVCWRWWEHVSAGTNTVNKYVIGKWK